MISEVLNDELQAKQPVSPKDQSVDKYYDEFSSHLKNRFNSTLVTSVEEPDLSAVEAELAEKSLDWLYAECGYTRIKIEISIACSANKVFC